MAAHPPAWLAELANQVALEMSGVDVLSPIGCHYFHNQEPPEQWEVSVFASRTEIVGGARDGQGTSSRFTLDLERIARLFADVKRFEWQGLEFGSDDEIGSHISIEGSYQGHSVWLRILAHAPKRFQSGRFAHAYQTRLEDVW